jgi:hypothetical protein
MAHLVTRTDKPAIDGGEAYIDWCERVLHAVVLVMRESVQARLIGAFDNQIAGVLFDGMFIESPQYWGSDERRSLLEALESLSQSGLIGAHQSVYKLTSLGEGHDKDKTDVYESICTLPLKPEQEELLTVVNLLSPEGTSAFGRPGWVDHEMLLLRLSWDQGFDLLAAVAQELHNQRLIERTLSLGRTLGAKATYLGMIRERRRQFTAESRQIDALVAEWETTSVDFKRQMETKTADQKAELIKDILSLANTKSSGRRLIVVGFQDSDHEYFAEPSPTLTQEHLEQLVSEYTAPFVEVRWRVLDYRQGPVGVLEVIRDPAKLPYRAARSIGDKKRMLEGHVFVRHGSVVEHPTDAELATLEEEGLRARGDAGSTIAPA